MPFLKTFLVSLVGGYILSLLHAPLPWTLGPIAAVSLMGLVKKSPMVWSVRIRNMAQILLGYSMGRSFSQETLQTILSHLPLMLSATLVTVSVGILTAWLMYRKTGISFTSCLLGCVPGGLSQMVILASEIKDADLTAVTIMQTIRMLSVVFTIPFLTIHFLAEKGHGDFDAIAHGVSGGATSETILVFAGVAVLGALLGKLLHFPTATLLGPILSTAVYTVYSGDTAPAAPLIYLNGAQICVGAYIGSSIDLAKITGYHGMGPALIGGLFLVLLASMGMGAVVSFLTDATFATAFLSTAPGGLTEMGITALVVGADISTMTAYQLTRLLFIMMVFPTIAKTIVKFHHRRNPT